MDIIFDVDGTLMNIEHRRKFVDGSMGYKDWKAFENAMIDDTPFPNVFYMARVLQDQGNRIIVLTGRNQRSENVTFKQLTESKLFPDKIMFRPDDSFAPDHVLKQAMLNVLRSEGFSPTLVFDDRDNVVDMWRQEGLTCFQCARGDF